MAENSKIEWTDHTFNPWVGCTKVSPACDHCYAEGWAKRSGMVKWGGPRKRTSEANWKKPAKWNREAKAAGVRRRVFCASLADVFDNQVPNEWREELWCLIRTTPHLDWLLLTKRPQNIAKMLPVDWNSGAGQGYFNVWLGTTAENQAEADKRIPHLQRIPAAVRFLSCEPLLAPLDLDRGGFSFLRRLVDPSNRSNVYEPVNWVICGGESGHGARDMDADWARELRDDCKSAGVAFFMKQMTKKAAIPDDLMIREFPTAA